MDSASATMLSLRPHCRATSNRYWCCELGSGVRISGTVVTCSTEMRLRTVKRIGAADQINLLAHQFLAGPLGAIKLARRGQDRQIDLAGLQKTEQPAGAFGEGEVDFRRQLPHAMRQWRKENFADGGGRADAHGAGHALGDFREIVADLLEFLK